MSALAERLRRAGVSQAQVAEEVELSGAEVCRQVNGLRPLDPRVEVVCEKLIEKAAARRLSGIPKAVLEVTDC